MGRRIVVGCLVFWVSWQFFEFPCVEIVGGERGEVHGHLEHGFFFAYRKV